MTLNPIPLRAESTLECRTCGAGAPVDEHFCPQCTRILALDRHGDYFTFFGLPRQLNLDQKELEARFRELSRKFHPDYFYNAAPAERLASLERSSYLNDAYRTLRQPMSRVEYLLQVEGMPAGGNGEGSKQVPASLLEEVFALNEELDEVREMRASGAPPEAWKARLERAREVAEGLAEQRAEHGVLGHNLGHEGRRSVLEGRADGARIDIEHAIGEAAIDPGMAVMGLVGVDDHDLASPAGAQAATVMERLGAPDRQADCIGLVPVQIVGMTAETGAEALQASLGLVEADPVRGSGGGLHDRSRFEPPEMRYQAHDL